MLPSPFCARACTCRAARRAPGTYGWHRAGASRPLPAPLAGCAGGGHARGFTHDQRLARPDRAGVDHGQVEQAGAPGFLAQARAARHGADHRAGGMRIQLAARTRDGEQDGAVAVGHHIAQQVFFQLALEQRDRFGVVVLAADQVLLVERGQRVFIARIGDEMLARADAERDRVDLQLGHDVARQIARGIGQDGCLLHIVVSTEPVSP